MQSIKHTVKILAVMAALVVAGASFSTALAAHGDWTWVDGSSHIEQWGVYGTEDVAAPENIPGSREAAATWTDANGNFWLFGGVGFDTYGLYGLLNDLWMRDATTGYWTWVDGRAAMNQ